MSGLFDTFTIAKRGLNVNQSAINTTSHNIANANTEGYSRQRAVAETTKPFGGMSRFDTCSVGQVGTGAEIASIQRIRDSFIDYQVRNEDGKLANYKVKSDMLSKVEDIFGEPSDKGIQALFSEFYSSFQELAKTPEKTAARTVAVQKASALANALNSTYTKLEKANADAQELLQTNVTDVNSYLDQINELNKQITSVSAVGQTPNDLMDKRDNLLDKLSGKFGITIERKDKEAIDLKAEGFQKSSNVIDNLVNSSPTDENYTRLSYVKEASISDDNSTMTVSYYPLGNSQAAPKTLTITGLNKTTAASLKESLEQNRILTANKDGEITVRNSTTDATTGKATCTTEVLHDGDSVALSKFNAMFKTYESDATNSVDDKTIKGDIAGNQSTQNRIKDYMDDLNKIATGLAYCVNAVQTGSSDAASPLKDVNDNDFQSIFVNGKTSTSDDGITAKNITVNQKIIDDVSLVNCSSTNTSGERNGDRAQVIADLGTLKMNISDIDSITSRKDFFSTTSKIGVTLSGGIKLSGNTSGKTIDNYYKDMISALGTDSQEANRNTATEEVQVENLQLQRTSVSGVSLDEEMTNLIQFQHAYQANAKIISTVDELLDVVINGLKK
ncbi:flagellar hook-associated protein FlgK [Clostridium saccharobutylicum]|uniref:Flagellar hook-associated protein 1 n=1 Tax=Clostridium saccharobutylicum TaxID=169679 RepID=A0A1S8NIH8_CLOSA|nr:flagellar hook-associated protein FlgK [Clostridium saccharobutylicum]OOM16279.1 flagellar hook-associated protein 1 [Clostridium saccharobutylicum]